MSLLKVVRNQTSADAFFGRVYLDDQFICYSLENRAKAIDPGTYTARLDMSPRLRYVCPHLRVPNRDNQAGGDAGIRIHVANEPHQLCGCLAVGESLGTDWLDHSRIAFDRLMTLLPPEFTVEIS